MSLSAVSPLRIEILPPFPDMKDLFDLVLFFLPTELHAFVLEVGAFTPILILSHTYKHNRVGLGDYGIDA